MSSKVLEEKLPTKLNFGIWFRIMKYAMKRVDLFAIIILTMFITTFYDSAFVPAMNAAAITLVGQTGVLSSISSLWELPLHVIFIKNVWEIDITFLTFLITQGIFVIIRCVSIFVTFYLTNYLNMVVMISLRKDLFDHVQELSFSYFDRTNSGWLIARMNNDTSAIGDVLSWSLTSIFWSSFDLIFTIITMFSQNVKYALIVIASLPFIAIIVPLFERLILKRHRIARNAYSAYVGWLAEIINGAKTVKTLSLEEEVSKESKDIVDDLKKKRFRAGRIGAFFRPLLEFILAVMIVIIVVVGYQDIDNIALQDGLDMATLVATIVLFVGFAQSIFSPLESMSDTFSSFMENQASAEKVEQLLKAPVEIKDADEVVTKYGDILSPKKENYEPFSGDIEFRNLSFHYGNGVEVIHPLNLKIKAGTSVAIVGETGSGKTTLANLLCRFYEPTGGEILLDGVNYKERSLGWLRSHIGYVQQSPFVFSATYFQNIAYGKLDATMNEVKKAAKVVGIDSFIEKEKDGYNTYLEDGGSSLSQGQRQLVSFARAMIRNPSLLILDEATSSIDTETEEEIQNRIQPLLKGRTSITIAHRLSTIVNSDRILVMEHGNIVEDGNHKELMEKKGYYYNLYMNQFKGMSMGEQIEKYQKQIEDKNIKI